MIAYFIYIGLSELLFEIARRYSTMIIDEFVWSIIQVTNYFNLMQSTDLEDKIDWLIYQCRNWMTH